MSHPGPETGAGDSRTRRTNPALLRSWIGLPIPLLLVMILTLWSATSSDTHESWVLGLTLTLLFSSLTALAATTLASLDFLASGSLGSLLLGCGALFWSGAGGIGMLLGRYDIDSQVAFHNLSAWLAAACHLAGCCSHGAPGSSRPPACTCRWRTRASWA